MSKEWVESGDVLSLLEKAENVELHFLLRPRKVFIYYQTGDVPRWNRTLAKASLMHSPTLGTIPLYESPTVSGMLAPPSPKPLSTSCSEFQNEPDMKMAEILVHFTLCVSQVLLSVCEELKLESDDYVLCTDTPEGGNYV